MKVAILMHGITGRTDKYGTGNDLDCRLSHKHFKKHILEVNEHVDVFYHTWSKQNEQLLQQIYNPKKYIAEEQIHFNFKYSVGPGHGGEGKFTGIENLRFHSLYSKWYSAQQANQLKSEYENENGFKYDIVMLTRFDLAYLMDFDFKKFDKEKFHLIGPDGNDKGFNDLWFFSSSNNMDKFCNLYDYVKNIKHFPHKHTHNHYYSREYSKKIGLFEKVKFIGHRAWMGSKLDPNGPEGGPSPTVRHFYKKSVQVPPEEDERVRQMVRKNNKIIKRKNNG